MSRETKRQGHRGKREDGQCNGMMVGGSSRVVGGQGHLSATEQRRVLEIVNIQELWDLVLLLRQLVPISEKRWNI